MEKSAKIAISLPVDLLHDVEREHRATGESRREFFRLAVHDRLESKWETWANPKITDFKAGGNL